MCKSIKYVYWVKKDLFGLVWKVWLYRRHSKCNQLIKITMTISTVPHSRCSLFRLKYLPRLFKNCHFSCCCMFFDVGVKKRIVVVSIRIRSNRKLDLDNLKYSNMPSNNMSPCVFVEAVIVLDSRRNFSLCFFDFLRAFQKFKNSDNALSKCSL